MRFPVFGLACLVCLPACKGSSNGQPAPVTATAEPPVTPTPASGVAPERAEVGKLAPDFELTDLEGKKVKLSDHRGKVVVLEWFNPQCPFVKASHTKGSLVGTAARHEKNGVVWLAVNSSAPGKQGHGVDVNTEGKKQYSMPHPVLLDESGRVGQSYGAKTTPHMFVIDQDGKLVYAGAIDNSPDGEGESPSDGKLVNYVDLAVQAAKDRKQPSVATSEPYGCSVKYAK